MTHEPTPSTIEVRLFGELARRFGATTAAPLHREVPVDAGALIVDVLAGLGIRPEEVGHLFLNAQYSTPARPVKAGDRLGVFGRDMALLYRQYFRPIADGPA